MSFGDSIRPLRIAAAAAVGVTCVSLLLPISPAHATTNVQIACGYSTPAGVDTSNCQSLDDALAAANQSTDPTTIELLPGDYCPQDISVPASSFGEVRPLALVGEGAAAFTTADPPPSSSEAELTQFVWDSTACGSTPPDAELSFTGAGASFVTLSNVGIDAVSGGPSTGLDARFDGLEMTAKGIVVRGFNDGIRRDGDPSNARLPLAVKDSAVVGNTTGVVLGQLTTVTSTTVADNTTGLQWTPEIEPESLTATDLVDDTIADNETGIDGTGGFVAQTVDNDIVAGNGTDCTGGLDEDGNWEMDGPAEGHNLLAPGCPALAATDVQAAANLDVPAVADNGGLTPSVEPPPSAVGIGDPSQCPLADQRGAARASSDPCDAGAVDSTGNDTVTLAVSKEGNQSSLPTLSGTTVTFGDVPVDDGIMNLAGTEIDISNSGGGAMSFKQLTSSGAVAVVQSTCLGSIFLGQASDACSFGIEADPTQRGPFTGTVTLTGAAGTPTVTLSVTGTAAQLPSTPADLTAVHGPHNSVSLSWSAPADDGGAALNNYRVEYGPDDQQSADYQEVPATTTTAEFQPYSGDQWFFVEACNAIGCGPTSVAGPITVPPDQLSVTAPSNQTIDVGRSITLTTAVVDVDKDTPCAYGTTVQLLASPPGKPFTTAASTYCGTNGTAKARMAPQVNTRYKWLVGEDGDNAGPDTSAIGTVSVRPTLSVALTPHKVAAKKSAQVYGVVSPADSGQVVRLQRKVSGDWQNVGSAIRIKTQALPNGKTAIGYVVTVKETKAGSYVFRVLKPASDTNTQANSATVTLRVTAAASS